ncbi:hypothetical protein NP233_g6202 [Leucocoprinus birnbaumii]|uniref:Sin3 C-terminal domain-containing protein n=1 Tax=Leucocoprinus birnbaumii TaxID=56174 RepID=A0AAD5YQ82_9AGAR|nr:hypothetical protein NP233_g6202 [Leucocoprinus birnbaumii]
MALPFRFSTEYGRDPANGQIAYNYWTPSRDSPEVFYVVLLAYIQDGQSPTELKINVDEDFSISLHKDETFIDCTSFPQVDYLLFDIDKGDWVELGRRNKIDLSANIRPHYPFFLTKKAGLKDKDCPGMRHYIQCLRGRRYSDEGVASPGPELIGRGLIGKDDSSFDDAEVLTGRWQAYIDSYVSSENTAGVSHARVRLPYLRRTIPAKVRDIQPEVITQDGQEIKVCVRTYRLFYVSDKEDYLWKFRSKTEMEGNAVNLKKRNVLRRKWLEKSKVMPAFVAVGKGKEKESEKVVEAEKEKETPKKDVEKEKETEKVIKEPKEKEKELVVENLPEKAEKAKDTSPVVPSVEPPPESPETVGEPREEGEVTPEANPVPPETSS